MFMYMYMYINTFVLCMYMYMYMYISYTINTLNMYYLHFIQHILYIHVHVHVYVYMYCVHILHQDIIQRTPDKHPDYKNLKIALGVMVSTLHVHGSSFSLSQVTALGVLCCFALFVCLPLLASFFHLSFKNMYTYIHVHTCRKGYLHVLMRDKKEGRKKRARSYKQQHSPPKAVTFPKKMSCSMLHVYVHTAYKHHECSVHGVSVQYVRVQCTYMDILCVYMYMCKCCYKRKFLKAMGFNNIAGI